MDVVLKELETRFKNLVSFKGILDLYMILLRAYFKKHLHSFKFEDYFDPETDDEGEEAFEIKIDPSLTGKHKHLAMQERDKKIAEAMERCWKQNIIVPADEHELCVRLHWLIKASLGVRVNFAEGQKRNLASVLNSIGLNISAFGYESFATPSPEDRLDVVRISADQQTTNYRSVFKGQLGNAFFGHAATPCYYRFYAAASLPETELFTRELTVALFDKSRALVKQSNMAQSKAVSDLFIDLINHLVEEHVNEIHPFVSKTTLITDNTPKKQKKDDGTFIATSVCRTTYLMKDMELYKKHCSILIHKTLHGSQFTFPSIVQFLEVFYKCAEGAFFEKEKPSAKKSMSMREAVLDEDTKEQGTSRKENPTEEDASRSAPTKPLTEWLDPETYPEVERATKWYFPAEELQATKLSPEAVAYLGFHSKAGNFVGRTETFSFETPNIWQDFLSFFVLTVHNKQTATNVKWMIKNRGGRDDHGYPQTGLIYVVNPMGQSAPCNPSVS